MKFDLSKVEFSWKDKRKNLKFPERLTPEIAEMAGIHIGDGHMGFRTDKGYLMQWGGNQYNEVDYYEKHIKKLWKENFNIDLKTSLMCGDTCYGFQFYSQAIFTFFNKVLKIPHGNKCKKVRIPGLFKSTKKEIRIALLRGIIDTDFYLIKSKNHIRLGGWFASRNLVLDLSKEFKKLGFNPKVLLDDVYFNTTTASYLTRHKVEITRKKEIEKWFVLIGTNNPKIYNRYMSYKI